MGAGAWNGGRRADRLRVRLVIRRKRSPSSSVIHDPSSDASFEHFAREIAAAYESQRTGLLWKGRRFNTEACWTAMPGDLRDIVAAQTESWLLLLGTGTVSHKAAC